MKSSRSDLKSLREKIDQNVAPQSIALDQANLKGNVKINTTQVKVKIVVAMLPGEGPHADEYVVIGAHYDHVGKGEIGAMPQNSGQIHSGAPGLLPRNTKPGRKPAFVAQTIERLRSEVAIKSDITLCELRDIIGIQVDLAVYCRALRKLGRSRKKQSTKASEQDCPDVKAAREVWHENRT